MRLKTGALLHGLMMITFLGNKMITMICGLPNAGKTTYSRRYNNALHQDDLGTTDNVIEAIKQAGADVVVEGVFSTCDIRRRVLSAYGGKSRCIFIDITAEESIRRENRNRHPQILRNAARFFEPPTFAEGWDEIIVIKGENNVERYYRQEQD